MDWKLQIASSVLLLGVSSGWALKVMDGTAKQIIVFHQWSWGLGNALSSSTLNEFGLSQLSASGKEFTNPVWDDDMQPKKGNWLYAASTKTLIDSYGSKPVIFILWIGGVGISGPGDTANINLAVRKARKTEQVLKEMGVDEVFFSTRHYRWMRARNGGSYNEMNDSLIVNAYNKAVGTTKAISIMLDSYNADWAHSKSDWEHPTKTGLRLYGLRWLKTMARYDGDQGPLIQKLDAALATTLKNGLAERNQLAIAFASTPPKTLRIGDKVSLNIVNKNSSVPGGVTIVITGFRKAAAWDYVLVDSLPNSRTSVEITIPDSASLRMYSPIGKTMFPVGGDSAVFKVAGIATLSGGGSKWGFTQGFQILSRTGGSTVGIAPRRQARATPTRVFGGSTFWTCDGRRVLNERAATGPRVIVAQDKQTGRAALRALRSRGAR